MSRLVFSGLLLVIVISLGLGCRTQQAEDRFPDFEHRGVILHPDSLEYNPCDDVIFPSVVRADLIFTNPLGKYYLYYAPHNAPGGICLAYSDSLTGGWTEYHTNPLIRNIWEPHYRVSHISSPHAIWNPEEESLFLYYHGENSHTRLASSVNGVEFEYEGVAMDTRQYAGEKAVSYARVFRYSLPAKDNRWIMLWSGMKADSLRIYLAWSKDGRDWTAQDEPLISPPSLEHIHHLCSPFYFPHQGKHYVLYHADFFPPDVDGMLTDVLATEVGAAFDRQRFAGTVYRHTAVSESNYRESDPFLVREGNRWYLFTSIGKRLNQSLAVATAPVRDEPLNP